MAWSVPGFALPDPVSIKVGEVLSMPFLSDSLDAQAVAHVRTDALHGGSDLTPMGLALNVRNSTPARLPAGILTIYDGEDGFAGDAQVPMMESGSLHTLVFGHDSGARVGKREKTEYVLRAIAPGSGVLTVSQDLVATTNVRVEGLENKAVTAVVDTPWDEGANLTANGAAFEETTVNGTSRVARFSKDLEPGEVWTFETVARTPQRTEWFIGDIGDAQLLAWAQSSPDEQTRAWLMEAADLRKAITTLEADIRNLESLRIDLQTNQERRRGLIEVLAAGTPAYDRFLAEILEAEDDLVAVEDDRRGALERLEEARASFAEHLQQPQ